MVNKSLSLRMYIGLFLTLPSIAGTVGAVILNIGEGKGFRALAAIVATLALLGLFLTILRYHSSPDLMQWPGIMMTAFVASNFFRIVEEHWSFVFMALPLAALILMILWQDRGEPGIAAGVLLMVVHYGISALFFRNEINSSLYLASLLVRPNFLMGIACICFFCHIPKDHKETVLTGIKKKEKIQENRFGV